MWLDLSKKIHWIVTVMGSCFLCIFFITLIANYFEIKIYHDSLWGIIKTFTILFFLPMYVSYKAMFIFGYVKEQSEINIYSETFWGILVITQWMPATMGWVCANNLYKEISIKKAEQTYSSQHQQSQNSENRKPWEMDWDQTNNQVQTEQNTNAENHSEKYVQESNSSNSFSDPNYGKDLNISDKTQSAEQLHYDSILAVHPDALEIAKQIEFENWINSHSPEWRKYYDDVANSGTADQVIQMINDYKANIIH